jgi:hypothetical protein
MNEDTGTNPANNAQMPKIINGIFMVSVPSP